MGITGLAPLIADEAPEAIKTTELKSYFGRRIAIDASMCLYQFMIAIRNMTNESGDNTSHIIGFFYRTAKLLEAGIKPVYVFDGKAPKLKAGTLDQRKKNREEAAKKLEETGDTEKYAKRLVRVVRKDAEDVKTLLKLMGLPIVEAPSEAEAQCAQLCKENLVYAVATEDMDALTFGAPKLIRNLGSGSREDLKEFDLDKCLNGLQLNMEEFVDLCILMGCDYCPSINGIGKKKGLVLIRELSSIEKILTDKYGITEFVEEVDVGYDLRKSQEEEVIEEKGTGSSKDPKANDNEQKSNGDGKKEDGNRDSDENGSEEDEESSKEKKGKKKEKMDPKEKVPDDWLFKGARRLFLEPNVLKGSITESDLKIKNPDDEGLVAFLCGEHGFSEERVRGTLKRIKNSKPNASQTRIDNFFKPRPDLVPKSSPDKRKAQPSKSSSKPTSSKRGRKPK